MGISRSQLMAGVAGVAGVAVLAGGGYLLHVRQQLLKDQFDATTQVILQKGVQGTGGSYSCSNAEGNQRIISDGTFIQFTSGGDSLRPDAWLRATKISNSLYSFVQVSVGVNPFGVVGEQNLVFFERPAHLKGMEKKARELCGADNPNVLSSQLGGPVQSSGSVALGFLQWQGNTNG